MQTLLVLAGLCLLTLLVGNFSFLLGLFCVLVAFFFSISLNISVFRMAAERVIYLTQNIDLSKVEKLAYKTDDK